MLPYDQYRPPGRSNRPGRAHADNDVFDGLPVKQWGQSVSHVSLAPPRSATTVTENDRWADPPLPRDSHLLLPWTQQLLRIALSGKWGTKRKSDPDSMDDEKPDEEVHEDAKANLEDRGYVAKKWKPVPEALLEPEHKHFEFLAKRRRGLPSLYAPDVHNGPHVPMRKTKVLKTGPEGEVIIYETLVPEGQVVDGEISETTELADIKPAEVAPGTVIEGVGIANEEGIVVAEHLKPTHAPRRNRPPPKKKGGPGRGKKRVTFTNPDGSTYTTIVPNATKIVPQPGQTVTHVAKGEEAKADISVEQAAAIAAAQPGPGEGEEGEDGEGEGSDDDGEDGEDDDDREEGELSDDDTPMTGPTPVPASKDEAAADSLLRPSEDVKMDAEPASTRTEDVASPAKRSAERDASSSPDLPLAGNVDNQQDSLGTPPATDLAAAIDDDLAVNRPEATDQESNGNDVAVDNAAPVTQQATDIRSPLESLENGDEDLLGNLEQSLGAEDDPPSA